MIEIENIYFLLFAYYLFRVADKIVPIHEYIWACRSGSASDTQAVVDYVRHHVNSHRLIKNSPFNFIIIIIIIIIIITTTLK